MNELQPLDDNHTWDLVPLSPNKKSIGYKWIFKLKFMANGTIERYKPRLVAKGITQTEGIHYQKTFSTMVKMNTIRLLLSIVASNNWHIHQLNINTAFLHGDLEEDVYMKVPPV